MLLPLRVILPSPLFQRAIAGRLIGCLTLMAAFRGWRLMQFLAAAQNDPVLASDSIGRIFCAATPALSLPHLLPPRQAGEGAQQPHLAAGWAMRGTCSDGMGSRVGLSARKQGAAFTANEVADRI